MDHFAGVRMVDEDDEPLSSSPTIARVASSTTKKTGSDPIPLLTTTASARIASTWQAKNNKLAIVPCGPGDDEEEAGMVASMRNAILTNFTRLLPILDWAPKLTRDLVKADVISGLTVGVMVIPQSMSYAAIAGLQYKYGMYSALVPIFTYAILGTSRQLGVGPVAMVSLLVEVGLRGALTASECPEYFQQGNESSALYNPDQAQWLAQYDLCPDEYAQLAFLTSFIVGVIQIGAAVLQLGFIVSFLSHSVISGFTSGAAIIIGLSQVQYFFGYKVAKSQYVHEMLYNIFSKVSQTNGTTFGMGLAWWAMLAIARRLAQHKKTKKYCSWLRACAPLLVCVLGILIAANLELFNGCSFTACHPDEKNPYIVGEIPSGFPSFTGGALDFNKFTAVISTAISATLIGYMESIAIAKSLAAKHKYEIDPGQELTALGFANLLGSFFAAYPITGSFSRSAVNNAVGAKTQLAGMITSLLMLLTLLVLTPLFYFLPKFCLAAIVIASVTNLVDYKEPIHLWKVKRSDCFLWFLAFFGTLFLGVQLGIIIAVGTSLLIVIHESVRPQISILWKLPNQPIYRNIKQESAGSFTAGIVVLRLGASMYFANVAFIRDYLHRIVDEKSGIYAAHSPDESSSGVAEPVKYIVIEMTPVISIDSTALHMLEDLHADLKERGVRLAFSTVGNRVEETMRRAGLINKMGAEWFHPTVHEAVEACVEHRSQVSRAAGSRAAAAGDETDSNHTNSASDHGDAVAAHSVAVSVVS